MKKMYKHLSTVLSVRGLLAVMLTLALPAVMWAQAARTVSGTVVDEIGEPLIGVSVTIPGQNVGVTTDIDGNYRIAVPAGATKISFSYVGYTTQELEITSDRLDVTMDPGSQALQEMVVIGYGTTKKNDLTGSVTAISEKDFNKGVISSPEELINGKIAGVQITNSGGSPNAGATIRVRGGASLNASNDPLIVLDGVPMEVGGGVEGSGNFLSLINPNDIESMTILKDASSTAIYGSRASNGVIIITTKKGSGDGVKVSFRTTNSISHKGRTGKVLSNSQFRDVIKQFGTADQVALLGEHDTNWNDEIFRTAFGTDNSLSVAGRVASWLPFRVAVGALYQDGILRTDNSNRYTANINLNPSFFNDHLRINLSGKGTYAHNRHANTGAIWNASAYDPTQPVYGTLDANGNQIMTPDGQPIFGGFHEVVDGANNPAQGAIANPVAMLEQRHNRSKVWRFVGNFDIDYRLHPLPELRLHVTGGLDYSTGKRTEWEPQNSFGNYTSGGYRYTCGPQKNTNRLLTVYANYNKTFDAIRSTLDATVGYDYQYWRNDYPAYDTTNEAGEVTNTSTAYDNRHTLLSYYGRVNYSYDSRYLLTATFRRDGSSRFAKNNRWGTFPSVALAWRVAGEDFFENARTVMNDFKIRASYGVTGQQDGIENYGYLSNYTISNPGAYYWFNGQWIPLYRPQAYNPDLRWETTKSWNFGIDFGFLNNRISGTVDFYTRKTEDLLATVPVPAGINFNKTMLTNVGNVSSKGVEIALNANIIDTKDWSWTATFNATWQENKITNLSLVPGTDAADTSVGYMEGTPVMVYKTGYAPNTFKVFKQIYDPETGRPIEGMYADLNGDGRITDEDQYYYHKASPDWIFGLSTSLRWKKWTLSTALRAQVGNYLYNGTAANKGAWECVSWNVGQVNNLSSSFLDTNFRYKQYGSDHYVENASFLKMDNIQLSYNFGRIGKHVDLTVSAMMQNVFTITKYSGVDPESDWGIESDMYPRPRTYSLSIGLNF
ncbi:MAG: TonB-dependent receptor [Muribaculaceae bacterium]|nr:TonB-dependent receptor [Muribaculaceae bacterium]